MVVSNLFYFKGKLVKKNLKYKKPNQTPWLCGPRAFSPWPL